MRITLYKNCKLSNRYNMVYDLTKTSTGSDGGYVSALTLYLSSLTANVIELPNTYYSRNMSFTLNISGDSKFKDAFSYNYCYIQTDDGLERYCFITSIDLGNTVATFHTEEDIWSTYALGMTIDYGYLTNSRQLKYTVDEKEKGINYYLLPTSYQSNDEPTVKSAHNVKGDFNIVAQIQVYNLKSGGEISDRQVRTVIFAKAEKTGETYEESIAYFSSDEVTEIIGRLQVLSGTSDLTPGIDINGVGNYYQIDNITVLPVELGLEKCIEGKTQEKLNACKVGISLAGWGVEGIYLEFLNYPRLFYSTGEIKGKMKNIYNGALENNFKVISFGTRSSQYEINMNGTKLKYSLKVSATDWDFKLLLSFQQKIIDITEDFVLKVPFDSVTGDTLAQRKIAKNTAIYNGVTQIIGGTAKIATSAASLGSGGITETTKINRSRKTGKVTSRTMTKSGSKSDNGSGIVSGAIDVADGIVAIVNANTPQYTSNRGTFVISEGLYNASYGLCYQEVVPDNETFVEQMLDICGYVVYEIITNEDIIFNQSFTDKNVLKFETVVLHGDFPVDVKEQLEAILENGFIIYY